MKRIFSPLFAGLLFMALLAGCAPSGGAGPAETTASRTTSAPAETTSPGTTHVEEAHIDFSGVLGVGDRCDTFVARGDGTVWTSCWEDGGGAGFRADEASALKAAVELVYAFDMKPHRLVIGQWTGFAIDQGETLWGWGMCVPGSRDFSERSKLTRILEGVEDVEGEDGLSAALTGEGGLWVWGDRDFLRGDVVIAPPEKWMDGVVSCGFCGDRLAAVNGRGELYLFAPDGSCVKAGDGVRSVEGGFVFGGDGALYELDADGALVLIQAQAKQATRLAGGEILVLGEDKVLCLHKAGAEARELARGVRLLVEADDILFIDDSGRLCTVSGGAVCVIDSGVLCAASNGDRVLLYIKDDATVWKIQSGAAEDEWHRLPAALVMSGAAIS